MNNEILKILIILVVQFGVFLYIFFSSPVCKKAKLSIHNQKKFIKIFAFIMIIMGLFSYKNLLYDLFTLSVNKNYAKKITCTIKSIDEKNGTRWTLTHSILCDDKIFVGYLIDSSIRKGFKFKLTYLPKSKTLIKITSLETLK